MSFETVVAISAITEFIVLSAIGLTLANAFSHGALAPFAFAWKQEPAVAEAAARNRQNEETQYPRAA